MEAAIQEYFRSIAVKFKHEDTSELGYRADFENLLKQIFKDSDVYRFTHDGKVENRNKPDFVVRKNDIPILYIETKDIGCDLNQEEKSEQLKRYFGYGNLILTDYLEFRFYRFGRPYSAPIKIGAASLKTRNIEPKDAEFSRLVKAIIDFSSSLKEPIRTGKHLAKIMAGKAQRIRDNIISYLGRESDNNIQLSKIYEIIKKLLLHDLQKEKFADMYAQTLIYGLFVARFYDETKDDFSRQEARDLIPKTSPFLRHFFDHIVGPDFDKRLEIIVNELCEVFSHTDIDEMMKEYFTADLWGNEIRSPDPVIHFYEDFLREYDPELRKKMGAYYTPSPVVNFIVKSTDLILKRNFKLENGICNTDKSKDGKHKVQILDPATGTGTFICSLIRFIYKDVIKSGQKGRWPQYVHHDLLPRIYGFEVMMAPYTIAHLKLAMAFRETGFKYFNNRLGIYLTNSLEDACHEEDLFSLGLAQTISEESIHAEKVKKETPIMVVIGNPPYSGESSNLSYNENNVYKREPSGGPLKERTIKWLNDDYVKFIRFAEKIVEQNGSGIVSYITAHGYIDNPTFRGMRWHLMKTFDKIYIYDLHGNANKKEKAPDGSPDENVFSIKQGVAIIFCIKDNSGSGMASIFKADLYGDRAKKYSFLEQNDISTVKWEQVDPQEKNYIWVKTDRVTNTSYNKGFSVDEIFEKNGVGIVTARDKFVIADDPKILKRNVQKFISSNAKTASELCIEVGISNKKGWNALKARDLLKNEKNIEEYIQQIAYRPFDNKYIFYHRALVWRMVDQIMSHLLSPGNFALLYKRQCKQDFTYAFVSNQLTESCMFESAYANNSVAPLYLKNEDNKKILNLNTEIVDKIQNNAGSVSGEQIFYYIYGTLFSDKYRKKYNDELKKDFPKIPYPHDAGEFVAISEIGSSLCKIHLNQKASSSSKPTFPIEGDCVVESFKIDSDKIFLNKTQYFGNISDGIANYKIGGHPILQRYIKDRKKQRLTNQEIEQIQNICGVLKETIELSKKVDEYITV